MGASRLREIMGRKVAMRISLVNTQIWFTMEQVAPTLKLAARTQIPKRHTDRPDGIVCQRRCILIGGVIRQLGTAVLLQMCQLRKQVYSSVAMGAPTRDSPTLALSVPTTGEPKFIASAVTRSTRASKWQIRSAKRCPAPPHIAGPFVIDTSFGTFVMGAASRNSAYETTPYVDGYTRHRSACIGGHNIHLYKNKSLQECKAICDGLDACKAFEYGVDYGKAHYEAGDCNPQDTAEGVSAACGNDNNLDIYVKEAN